MCRQAAYPDVLSTNQDMKSRTVSSCCCHHTLTIVCDMRTEVRARCVGTILLYKSGLLIATLPKAFATGELDNLKGVICQLH